MDLNRIRQLLREARLNDSVGQGHSVVLVEDGKPPLVVRELPVEVAPTEVPIASRWPKGRTIHERETGNGAPKPASPEERASRGGQDQILERLNAEILALRELVAQEG
jgi:hypothetical protein